MLFYGSAGGSHFHGTSMELLKQNFLGASVEFPRYFHGSTYEVNRKFRGTSRILKKSKNFSRTSMEVLVFKFCGSFVVVLWNFIGTSI